MRARKGSGAEKLGIKFTGNPDAKDHCEKEAQKKKRKRPNPIDDPGVFLIGPLSK